MKKFVIFISVIFFACSGHRTQPKTFSWEELKSAAIQNGHWDSYRNPDGPTREQTLRILPDSVVVHDDKTGLTWQRGSSVLVLPEDAFGFVNDLNQSNFGGFNDWRVPTVEELYTLLLKTRNSQDNLYLDPIFDNSKIVVDEVFPNQAFLLSCDEVTMTLLDKTPIGEFPLYIDFVSGMSCGGGGKRAIRAVRN